MLDLLKFVFSDAAHYWGAVLLIVVTGTQFYWLVFALRGGRR